MINLDAQLEDAVADVLPVERETLFRLNGRDYTIPKSFRVNECLQFMHWQSTVGFAAALDRAFVLALGEQGYAELLAFEQLTQPQLDEIGTAIINKLMGVVRVPKVTSNSD